MKGSGRGGLSAAMFLFAAIAMGSNSPATSAVITFNGTAPNGGENYAGFSTINEGGFSAAVGGTAFFVDHNEPAFPGVATFDDDVLEFNDTSAHLTITKIGGGSFNLSSARIGSLGRTDPGYHDESDFVFTGTFVGGGTISLVVLALTAPVTYTFPGFNNLSSVVVTSIDGQFPVVDDITLAASQVPVPASLPLFLSGLAGLGLFVRRRIKPA
jgi:hypothetical protein